MTGSMTLWTTAYEQHRPAILAYLVRRLGNRDVAEDLCQETFARALHATHPLRDPSKVRAYLFRIAGNLLRNHVRRRGLVRAASDVGNATAIDRAAAPPRFDPASMAEQQEMVDRVRALLGQLPADQRLAFERGILERQPYAQIASAMGWSVAKVKISVYRARKHLIEGLRGHVPDAGNPRTGPSTGRRSHESV